MQFEAFSHPKARDLSVPPDDVILHIPGFVTAVFDGATDALGRKIDNISVGRLASISAAQALASLPSSCVEWPAQRIFENLSARIAKDLSALDRGSPASTTAMMAFTMRDRLRLVGLGDTGYRVNAGEAKITEIAPDRVSVPARVAFFRYLSSTGRSAAECEKLARYYLFNGFEQAKVDGIASAIDIQKIIAHAATFLSKTNVDDAVEHLLRNGLKVQSSFANDPVNPLGYGILNGASPLCRDAVDETYMFDDLTSLELFSDGYLDFPTQTTVLAWENCFASTERLDPHRLNQFQSTKGSTAEQFFDDRTVVILNGFDNICRQKKRSNL